jgi:hypothetical protein
LFLKTIDPRTHVVELIDGYQIHIYHFLIGALVGPQNAFRDAVLFEPILVFKASRHQLQPPYRRPSILRYPIWTPITFKAQAGTINLKAKAGTINPHPILMGITFKAKSGTIN